MIKIVKGDLTECSERVIVQQVNCQGAMGKGVAKALYTKYPEIRDIYRHRCKGVQPEMLLGKIMWHYLSDGKVLINCFAQLDYRRKNDTSDVVYTDYDAFRECMVQVKDLIGAGAIAAPMYIGCGLAGGDWSVIHGILSDIFNDNKITLKLYDLGGR